jgi:hypothetical protein
LTISFLVGAYRKGVTCGGCGGGAVARKSWPKKYNPRRTAITNKQTIRNIEKTHAWGFSGGRFGARGPL